MRQTPDTRRLITRALATFALSAAPSVAPTVAVAQKVVVSHDEWLTQTGFFNADERRLVANALGWFGLSAGDDVLLHSTNPFLTNAGFESYLSGLGYVVTVSTVPGPFGNYDAVFAAGLSTLDGPGLATYAQGGGNVFYIGGTGLGGAAGEAAYSNAFLNLVGLAFASAYNGVGTVNSSAFASQAPFGAALFTGVPTVYANNGNSVSAPGAPGWTTQVFSDAAGNGVFGAAVYATSVPEPAPLTLVIAGLAALVFVTRRRRTV